MGWLTGIGKFFGLINTNPTASSLAKDISSGVDMLVYTDEEKAIDKAAATTKAMDSWLKQVEAMRDSEAFRSVTRRMIAVGIVFNLICMIWLCIWAEVAATFGWFAALKVVTVNDLTFTPITWAVLKIAGTFQLGWVFCTIIVFYFGPSLIQFMKGKKV